MLQSMLIDSREPTWVQELPFGGVKRAVTLLQYGDLWATTDDGTLLVVERKTPNDLLHSIRSKRLWPQMAGLINASRWAYLVITGMLLPIADGRTVVGGRTTGWRWAAVQGALLKVQELGVFIVYAGSDEDYENVVLRLAKRDRRRQVPIEPARQGLWLGDAERILTALPGIGLEKVGPLLEYAGGPAWALQFLTDPDTPGHIDGIGPQTKRAVRDALGLKEDQELAVVQIENGTKENEHVR